MRKFTDPWVHCPFDATHRLPKPRLVWHLSKCPARQALKDKGVPVYHCKNNYLHVFMEEDKLKAHEALDCDSKREEEAEVKQQIDKWLSSTVEERESEGVVEIQRQEYDRSIGIEEVLPEVEFRKVTDPFKKKKGMGKLI